MTYSIPFIIINSLQYYYRYFFLLSEFIALTIPLAISSLSPMSPPMKPLAAPPLILDNFLDSILIYFSILYYILSFIKINRLLVIYANVVEIPYCRNG